MYWCMHAMAHAEARESFPSIHQVTLELHACHPVLWEALSPLSHHASSKPTLVWGSCFCLCFLGQVLTDLISQDSL